MDLKPVSRPSAQPDTVVNPGAAAPTEDPFKNDPPVIPPTPVTTKRRGGKGKKFLMILLMLVLLGGVGYGVYYWQQQEVDKLSKQNAALTAELEASKTKLTELENQDEEVVAPTTDEQVIKAVTNYCQAGVDPTTKKALVYTQGTSGADKKKVLYSTDKNFAYVNAACTAAATGAEGNYRGYYLKLSGDQWTVLYSGQEADPTATKTYNIPALADFK